MRTRALTTFAAATVRALFTLTLLMAAGAQAIVVGGHFEHAWAIPALDGRLAAAHPTPPVAHDHDAEAHVRCAVCRAMAMAGREGPSVPSASAPCAAALAAPLASGAAATDLPAAILGVQSRAPPV